MFKDQLHTSFDGISPSPELLDRVSAMMKEEAGKRKPPIYMNAVKYGGIAAAVALAVGGAFLAFNTNNRDIGTADAPQQTVAATSKAAAAAPVAPAADEFGEETAPENKVQMVAPDILITPEKLSDTTEAADNDVPEAAAEAAPEEPAYAEEAAPTADNIAGEAAESFIFEVTEGPVTTTAAAQTVAAETQVDENSAGDAGGVDILAFDEVKNVAPAEENYSEESLNNDIMSDEAADDFCDEEEDYDYADSPASEVNSIMPVEDDSAGAMTEEAATSREYVDMFSLPFVDFINGIPYIISELRDTTGWDKYNVDLSTVDSIDDYANIYTFITDFGVTRNEIERVQKDVTWLTAEQLDLLYGGDTEAITAAFATPIAIVKGDKAYSPFWLYSHSEKEWEKVGITTGDLVVVREYVTDTDIIGETIREDLLGRIDEYK